MNLAIIGFSGYVQRVYAPYLNILQDNHIRAICDLHPSIELKNLIIKALPNAYPRLYTDFRKLLDEEDVDSILISTPHKLHFEQAYACLAAGRHVFLDKPLACNYKDACELVDLARSRKLILAVGNQRRYEPPYQYLKSRLDSGEVGDVYLVNYLFANSPWYNYKSSWRGDSFLNCGGAMIDIGHLAADTIFWLLDRPLKWVHAFIPSSDNFIAERSVLIIAELEPCILLQMTISYAAPFPSVQEELSIYCTQNNLFMRRFRTNRFENPYPSFTEISKDGKANEIQFTQKVESWRPLEDFFLGIETGKPILSDGCRNLGTIEFIDSVYQSIRINSKVNLRI